MIKFTLTLRVAAQNPYLHERDVEAVVNTIFGRISDALVAGDRVELRGEGPRRTDCTKPENRRGSVVGR